MATEKILSTRIMLKVDELSNWEKSDLILKKGELAFATTAASTGTELSEPVTVVKIGDGEHKFSELTYNFYARSSDVLLACKTEAGLKTFINGVIADAGIASSDAMEALAGRVTNTENDIKTLKGDESTAGSVAKAIKDAIDALDLANTYVAIEDGKSLVDDAEITKLAGVSAGANKVEASTNGNIKIDGVDTVVYTHPDKHAIADVDGLQDALDGKQAAGDYAAEVHTHAISEVTGLESRLSTAEKTSTDNEIAIENLLEDSETKTDAVAKLAEAKAYTDEAVNVVSNDLDETNEALRAYKTTVSSTYETKSDAEAKLAEAKKYADDNDADTQYGIEYDSVNKKIKLVSDTSKTEIDATAFIKDGMVSNVEIKDGNLVITFNTDAGKDAINVPLESLVDVYTGVDGTTVKVEVSSDNKIGAEVKTGSIKDGHIASDAAIAKGKLASDVQTSLSLADSAVQEADIAGLRSASHTHTFADTDVVDAISKKHSHTFVESELNKIKDGDVAKWNAAEQNAKDYADDQIEALGLGTMSKETATNYVKKSEAVGYDDILTKTAAQSAYQAKGEYATSAQGAKADTAIQSVTSVANNGIKATTNGTAVTIDWDPNVVLVFDCGDSGAIA